MMCCGDVLCGCAVGMWGIVLMFLIYCQPGVECGVFVSMAAYCIVHNRPLNYSMTTCNSFRLYMALPILNQHVHGDMLLARLNHVCMNFVVIVDLLSDALFLIAV